MFRATHRSSSGAQNCTCSLWFTYNNRLNYLERTNKMRPCIRIHYSNVSYCPTCFERHIAHHQELKNCTCSLWFTYNNRLNYLERTNKMRPCIRIYYSIHRRISDIFVARSFRNGELEEPSNTERLFVDETSVSGTVGNEAIS